MNKQIILSIVFILALAGTIYFWLGGTTSSITPVPDAASAEKGESTAVQLAQLRKLKNLRLDTDILEDEFFRSLASPQGVPVLQQNEQGRPNPFLPL